MKLLLAVLWASLVYATSYTLSVYSPDTVIDGANLDAAGLAFYTGLKEPATYCPASVGNSCPYVEGTLVTLGMGAMAVPSPLNSLLLGPA